MFRCMRTTLTLDADVAALLQALREKKKMGLKDLVNQALRQGLRSLSAPEKTTRKPYRSRSVSLGRCLLGSIDDISEALAVAEGEDYR